MEFLKQFMRKNAYRLVYTSMGFGGHFPDFPSALFFGELPFPIQEYLSIKNRMI